MSGKSVVPTDQRVGITEAGDPAFNLGIFDCLYDANIIITKRLTDRLIKKLIEHKDKTILHCTCTGYGGTVVEPMVPKYMTTREKLGKLIEDGFPASHVVLRVDPIIPTPKGIKLASDVITAFSDLGIKRVRFSVIDMYNHAKERFKEHGLPLPHDTFHASAELRMSVYSELQQMGKKYGFEVEACGEPGIESASCLSQKDIDILGMSDKIRLIGGKGQRFDCHCPKNKTELITGKPERCPNGCLYCFWRD